VLNKQRVNTIFYQVEVLHKTHQALLNELERGIDSVGDGSCGLAFVRLAPFLRPHREYAVNYRHATAAFDELKADEHSVEILHQVKQTAIDSGAEGASLPLAALLIKPVQRMAVTALLIRDARRSTSPAHPDWEGLLAAGSAIAGVLEDMNQGDKDAEEMLKVVQISCSLLPCKPPLELIQPHRRLIKQGDLTLAATTLNRVVYLFNDMFLIAAFNVTFRLQVERVVPLISLHIDTVGDKGIVLKWIDDGDRENLELIAGTTALRDEWARALSDTVRAQHDKRKTFTPQ